MKNKLLVGLFTAMLCFTLVGCGNSSNDEKNYNDNSNQQQNQDNQNIGEDNNSNDIQVKLYSDDTKIVYNFYDTYKIVYYYKGNQVTGLEYYYNYETIEAAKYALTTIGVALKENNDGVKGIEQKGTYVIVKFDENEYSDLTVDEIKETYSYLEQIYKNQ